MKHYLKKIYFSIVRKLFELLYSKLRVADNNFFKKHIKIKKINLTKNSVKSYKIYEILKSRIYSDNNENVAIIKDNLIIPKLSVQFKKNCLIEVDKNSVLKTGTRSLLQKKIFGNVLSLTQGFSAINNYGHWMLDILPKLCIAEKFKNLNSFDAIYLPNINHSFQKDTLKYFKISNKKLIDGKNIKHIYADKFTIPQHPYWKLNKHQFATANIDREMIKILRSKFLNTIKKHNKKKIFIDRSDSVFPHSQIENYHEVIKVLKYYKFEIIKLSNIPFKDQISYFYNAKIVVGAHGAGLSNVIFCNPRTKLVEILSWKFKTELLKNISIINKLQYNRLISSKKPPPLKTFKPDIYVPIKKLIKLIS